MHGCFWAWEVAYMGRMGRGQRCCSLAPEDRLTCTTAHKVSSSLPVGWRKNLILRDVFKIAISDYSLAIHLLVHGFWDFIRFPVYIEDAFSCFFEKIWDEYICVYSWLWWLQVHIYISWLINLYTSDRFIYCTSNMYMCILFLYICKRSIGAIGDMKFS